MDISQAFKEMMKEEEPTFCNFNGVYLYGGCSTPPHESADRQTERLLLAGMAMQSLISVICSDVTKLESVLRDCNTRGLKNVHEWVAESALDYANALIGKSKGGQP